MSSVSSEKHNFQTITYYRTSYATNVYGWLNDDHHPKSGQNGGDNKITDAADNNYDRDDERDYVDAAADNFDYDW